MPIARKFLDWRKPALVSAAEFLIDRYESGGQLDLERVIVVTPGARAGRKLLELLVEYAEQLGRILVPPRIETVGRLPELLYYPQRPFASALVQQLAWVAALRSMGAAQLSRVIPQLPDQRDLLRWMELGQLLAGLHRELAAEALDFRHVLSNGIADGGSEEERRWKALRRVQESYLEKLDHLQLWDLQTARLVAIEHRECHTDHDIVLVATADLNLAVRRMLDQVAERVTALVFAPQQMADRFDEHGCLRPEVWSSVRIPLRSEQIVVADGPAQQVDEVAAHVAQFAATYNYGPHEIVVGAPDERLAPHIVRRLQECGAAARWGVGRPLTEQPAVRLLEAIAACLENPRFAQFAQLLRHPDLYDWLTEHAGQVGWLIELDQYYSEHLPPCFGNFAEPLADGAGAEPAKYAGLQAVQGLLQSWLEPLQSTKPLPQWAPLLGNVLAQVYERRDLNPENPVDHGLLETCRAIQSALESLLEIPAELAPTVTAAQALRIVLDQFSSGYVPSLANADAIEVLGWLELPLDVAPALIVTSFNEGFVPTSVNSDLFLPNALRRRLKLLDNHRRYARDAYALQTLAASRQQLLLIIGRRDDRGDPLVPSRLAFADQPQVMAQRVLALGQAWHTKGPIQDEHWEAAPPADRPTRFVVPAPLEMPALTSIPVTALRAYLQCPYRFYLRYVLRLRTIDDQLEELDAAAFGSLLHQVLSEFGRGAARDSTDAETIRAALEQSLSENVERQYGPQRLAPVNVQLRQLRARLEGFARWQAEWARQGWRIHDVEVPCRTTLHEASVAGKLLQISGRLDRIDRHADGRWLIFDYKSSDSGKCPEEVHYQAGRWVDLQLPLYRRLARELGIPGSARGGLESSSDSAGLGYILLPKDTQRIGAAIAGWSEDQLDAAEQAALEVARSILAAKFWPPASHVPFDDFAWICQQTVFHRQLAESS